jgi:serine/threonine protein phosphatase PrpC
LKFASSKSSKKYSLFGVFDGHGGREVAHYTKVHLEEAILENKHFKEEQVGEALR